MKQKDINKRELITLMNPFSPISEQFRMIRTSIDFADLENKFKKIVITSSEPGSGKSTVAANLAVTMAKQNKNILLIDADLRKPTVHETFSLIFSEGLSNVISGQLPLENALQKTTLNNLTVLTSGIIPPNPTEMLSSKKVVELLAQLEDKFDYLVIDTPPVNLVSDALIVTSLADGVVFVARNGVTRKDNFRNAILQIGRTSTPIIGTVYNGKAGKKRNYYYY